MAIYHDQDLLPRHSVLKKADHVLFKDDEIRNHVRASSEELSDTQIKMYMATAIEWVQDQLGKTLLTTTRETVCYNNRFVLPYGPVLWNASDHDNKNVIKKDTKHDIIIAYDVDSLIDDYPEIIVKNTDLLEIVETIDLEYN